MFGAGSEMVPLEFHCIDPGLDEWIKNAAMKTSALVCSKSLLVSATS